MPVIEKTVVIKAPVQKVFALVNDPKRHHEVIPGVKGVTVLTQTPTHVGEVWKVTYSMIGLKFSIKATVVEWEENKKSVWKAAGGLGGLETQTFEAMEKDLTRYTERMEVALKGGILGKALNWLLLERMFKRNVERAMQKIKATCEAEHAPSA